MKTIVINRFDRGIAEDRHNVGVGEYVVAKHFDTTTHPRKLQPMRGMSTHTANTTIGNLLVVSDGLIYGVGTDVSGGNPTLGKLYVLAGYGTDDFAALSTNQLSGAVVDYDFFLDWPDAGNVRKIHWASANLLVASVHSGGAGASTTDALTFSSIGQGFVHPKDKVLYFPYRTSTTPFIGTISSNATPFGTKNYTAFTLPLQYRAYCLTNYGDYLAIPLTSISAVSLTNSSIVALWRRDTSVTTFDETIQWGNGSLKVLNNLQGNLIGISEHGSNSLQSGSNQDYNAIHIKVWNGGSEPLLIKELKGFHLAGSNTPTVSINHRVNFINNNRLYFSVNIVPNDSVQPSLYGLFSVGRSKLTGEWSVNLERIATNANTETGVIAAVIVGDYVEIVHTAAGTLTKTSNGQTSSSTYGATSVYESGVNPGMEPIDKIRLKKLNAIIVNFEPLPSNATVVLKYRTDSVNDVDNWVTVATGSTAGSVAIEMPNAAGVAFTDGRDFEFRLESTGGAVITSWAYSFQEKETLI